MTKSLFRHKIEDAIQKELIRWLRETYPNVRVTATRNESNYRRTDEIEVGMPDLLIRQPRGEIMHIIYFEIKTMKGKLSPAQIKWAQQPRADNEHYGNGFGLIQCKEKLNDLLHYSNK
jgi:hypothetical protein